MTLIERAYTVKEIDRLRKACEDRYLFGTSAWDYIDQRHSRSYKEAEKSVAVEEMVRTHMIAGHTAEDLLEADRERFELKSAPTPPALFIDPGKPFRQ